MPRPKPGTVIAVRKLIGEHGPRAAATQLGLPLTEVVALADGHPIRTHGLTTAEIAIELAVVRSEADHARG